MAYPKEKSYKYRNRIHTSYCIMDNQKDFTIICHSCMHVWGKMIKAIFDLYLIGNTCRSTMSEGIMRHLVKTKGLQDKVSTITCLVLVMMNTYIGFHVSINLSVRSDWEKLNKSPHSPVKTSSVAKGDDPRCFSIYGLGLNRETQWIVTLV